MQDVTIKPNLKKRLFRDYLVKDGTYQNIDNEALKRLKLIQKMPKDERPYLFATMDAFFAKNKLQAFLQ